MKKTTSYKGLTGSDAPPLEFVEDITSAEMQFEKEDNGGRWRFMQFKTDGESFIGRFISLDASTIHPAIEGVVMCDMDGELTIISNYFQVQKYFSDKTPDDTVYKIVRKRKEDMKKGTVIVFDFYKAK